MKIFENKYVNIDHHELNEIKKVFDSKQLSGMSPTVTEYEKKLATYFSCNYARAVTNGTTGLEIALRVSGVMPGDDVITTPLGPVMTPLPILALGARPLFVDCESSTSFNVSLDDLKKKITPKTKALITVPMWGYPNDVTKIKEFCKEHSIILIEDASHCHGTIYKDHYQGTMGDLGVFSTQERKLIATGEGGFILTNNTVLAEKIEEIRNFGKPIQKQFIEQGLANQYGHLFGLNYRLNAFSAALGISQIDKLNTKIVQRTINANYYKKNIISNACQELPIVSHGKPNYYALVYTILSKKYTTYEIGKQLSAYGIISDTYRFNYSVLYDMPLFKQFHLPCPHAEKLAHSIITLPTHEGISTEELTFIIQKFNSLISE